MYHLTLSILPQRFAVCQLAPDEPVPAWLSRHHFWSVTRTVEELSIVAPEGSVPSDWNATRGWRALKILGPLDFDLVGVLASLSTTLAQARVSIFAISTYNTDYVLVRETDLDKAKDALSDSGHAFVTKSHSKSAPPRVATAVSGQDPL